MSRVDDILDTIDAGLQSSPEASYGNDNGGCIRDRCNNDNAEGSDFCEPCRSYMLGDTTADPAEDRPGWDPNCSGLAEPIRSLDDILDWIVVSQHSGEAPTSFQFGGDAWYWLLTKWPPIPTPPFTLFGVRVEQSDYLAIDLIEMRHDHGAHVRQWATSADDCTSCTWIDVGTVCNPDERIVETYCDEHMPEHIRDFRAMRQAEIDAVAEEQHDGE